MAKHYLLDARGEPYEVHSRATWVAEFARMRADTTQTNLWLIGMHEANMRVVSTRFHGIDITQPTPENQPGPVVWESRVIGPDGELLCTERYPSRKAAHHGHISLARAVDRGDL